jgi:hypothetical protein
MPRAAKPSRLTLRAYKVGFGDCFLLTFHYAAFQRHVLIDFGSSGMDKEDGGGARLLRIAEDIREQSGGKLHAVVATHRHRDHISGFATRKNGGGPGDIIASLEPEAVIQPWTEDPEAAPGALRATRTEPGKKAFVQSLAAMQSFCAGLVRELPALHGRIGPTALRQLSFLGETNLPNLAAVKNLQQMGPNWYVNFGSRCGLETLLPGVKTHVLGPPSLEQSEAIRGQRAQDAAEFWHLQSLAERSAASSKLRLFPGAAVHGGGALPPQTRWFIQRLERLRGEQLLGIVRALDEAMNNTSVILLFDCGSKKLLFPGDAQIENWSYALSRPGVRRLLEDVDVYKVGHHGSLNATPKSLWELFRKRSKESAPGRLMTINSTMPGKHGDARRGTEVPRRKLVDALAAESHYFSTEEIKGRNGIRQDFVFDL